MAVLSENAGCRMALPINDERFIRSLLVAHRTCPRWLLLIHLQIKGSIEALQVGAGEGTTRDRQAHLPQLRRKSSLVRVPTPPLGAQEPSSESRSLIQPSSRFSSLLYPPDT